VAPPALIGSPTVLVLLVEDDPQTRELFRAALREEGYAVVAVADGVDALTYLDAHTPAAMVLDLGLPRLHGRDVLAEVAERGFTRQVPVVVVTGEPTHGLDEYDVACVMTKPITSDALRETLIACLSRFGRQP
jgi:DNA-binding response OmpR family regulator